MANPTPTPMAASLKTHKTKRPGEGLGAAWGHTGKSEIVIPSARMTRIGLSMLLVPGMGMNTKTPETRISVKRKPITVEALSRGSGSIPAQVPQDQNRVGGQLLEHPGQRQDERAEKGQQTRNGAERRVLNRRQDLDQADDDTDDESDDQERRGQPERRHQRLAENLDYELRGHW